jgi:hypothetical protein
VCVFVGVARSPIFAMLSESLSGIATIRTNDSLDYFKHKFRGLHDVSLTVSLLASKRCM